MKLKRFCKAKDAVNRTKQQPTEWEKIFTKPTSDRGMTFKIHKQFKFLGDIYLYQLLCVLVKLF